GGGVSLTMSQNWCSSCGNRPAPARQRILSFDQCKRRDDEFSRRSNEKARPIGPSLKLACLFVGTPSERRSHLRKNGTSPAIRDIFLLQVATSMRQDMAGLKILVTCIDGSIGSGFRPRPLDKGRG